MKQINEELLVPEVQEKDGRPLPVNFVPTPTETYRTHRKLVRALVTSAKPTAPPTPSPGPQPRLSRGTRVLMWKQDPTVDDIGIRKAFLPGWYMAGPTDARITVAGISTVAPNVMGDFIAQLNTDDFDTVHAFAVVRQTLTMYQRAMNDAPLPWAWNTGRNTDPIQVYPHAGVTANAYYSRTEKALKFFYFNKPGDPATAPKIYTCRSLDIVSHETGHAVLDGLKPHWLLATNPPQTGGLHESFGDLTAIFLALSEFDLVDSIIVQTKCNLHDKTFLSDLAEQFGLALGRPNGLRNADNDLKLSEVGNEVHAISQVFTGGIYDILADLFAFEQKPNLRDDARVLYECAEYLRSLLLRAIIAAPVAAATYADVVNQMVTICAADGKPVAYRNAIRNQFVRREVVVSATPLTADHDAAKPLAAAIADSPGASQDRRFCCGTMQHYEYVGAEEGLGIEKKELEKAAMASVR
jgi:hypothetical protein